MIIDIDSKKPANYNFFKVVIQMKDQDGIRFVCSSHYEEGSYRYEVVDKRAFMLAVLKHGFEYKVVENKETTL